MNKSEKFWDKMSKRSDKGSAKPEEDYLKAIELAKNKLDRDDMVLDFACGRGKTTREMAKYAKEIVGVDFSSGMIEAAKKNALEEKIENISFEKSTIFNHKFKKESFNKILAFNILHLLEDGPNVMQRINELLKPGGLFISSTPCLSINSFLSVLFVLLSKTGLFPNIQKFNIPSLKELISNGNFQIIEVEELSKKPPNYFIVAKKPD